MNPLDHARTMAAYNAWMNDRMYEACATLPDAERKRDRGAFFRSIHGTLNHLLLADRVWLGRFGGEPFAPRSLDQELYADFAELRTGRARTDAAITAWAAALRADDFARDLTFRTISTPQQERRTPFWLVVTHFFNHQTHHRGQVTTLMKQSGVDPGVTDLLALPAELRA